MQRHMGLNNGVERLSLISLGRLLQRRLPRNKSEFIPLRVECAEEGAMYFLSLNHIGKKSP